ncbi:hypothetical protein QR680_010211 [Steinernema hermaphroditum]|uniref:Uncharacterized protein n=1 Tax=Steinernema hermaphroditum TaxID=289476 RepID=A0AA39IN59_9BILA|nr:hypothetical protein QR680_010211 [Steinernema hermaphroditum]
MSSAPGVTRTMLKRSAAIAAAFEPQSPTAPTDSTASTVLTPQPPQVVSVDTPKRTKPTPAARHVYAQGQAPSKPTLTVTITATSGQRSVQMVSSPEPSLTQPHAQGVHRSPEDWMREIDSLVTQCAKAAMKLANTRKAKKRIDESLRRTHVKCGFCDDPRPHYSDSCQIYATPKHGSTEQWSGTSAHFVQITRQEHAIPRGRHDITVMISTECITRRYVPFPQRTCKNHNGSWDSIAAP